MLLTRAMLTLAAMALLKHAAIKNLHARNAKLRRHCIANDLARLRAALVQLCPHVARVVVA